MAIYWEDIVDIDLAKEPLHRSFLSRSIGTADNKANRFGVRVFRNGELESLSGVSVQGYFRDPHGNNIAITTGNSSTGSNPAYVVLPQACYNYEGQFTLAIKLVGGGVTGTVRIVDGMVDNTNTGSAVAPTETVPTYSEILDVFEQMQDALEDAENFLNYSVANIYSDSATYAVGEYVTYNGKLYRCSTAVTTADSWENNSGNFAQCTAMGQLNGLREGVAPAYNESTTYSAGQYVCYNRYFWRSKQDGNTGNAPATGSSYWGKVDISNDLITRVEGEIAPAFSASSTYDVGDYVIHGGSLWRCKNAITTADSWNSGDWDECPNGLAIQMSRLWYDVAQKWVAGTEYHVGDYVTYKRHFYRMKIQPVQPRTVWTAGDWDLLDDLANDLQHEISNIEEDITDINNDITGIETALEALGASKTATGTGEIIVQDSTEANVKELTLKGYADLKYNTTNQEGASAYRAYGFNICSNPVITTKNQQAVTKSTNTFTGINLMKIDCVYSNGTVHESFQDKLVIGRNGRATLYQANGLLTPADIAAGAVSAYTNSYSYGDTRSRVQVTSGSTIWERFQKVPTNSVGATSRSAVICNIVPPRTNQNALTGYIEVTSTTLDIYIDNDYLPSSVTDTATFKAWFEANTSIQIFLPLITPETTVLPGTYAIKMVDGYTKLSCDKAGTPLSLTYYYDATMFIDQEIERLDGRIDNIDPIHMQRYHIASIISTLCAVGDSLTVGWGINTDPHTEAGISRTNKNIAWPTQYGRITGTTVDIIGGSGMTAENFWDNQFVIPGHPNGNFDDVLEVHDQSEVYVIGLGQNFNSSTAGSVSDIGQTAATCNEDTFYGAYAKIILTILEKYPKAKILCLTIPKDGDTAVNTCIRGVCNAVSGALLLDLQADYLELFTRDDIMNQRTTLRDVHYYPIGYSFIAQTMEYVISDYLFQNASDWHTFGIA